MGCQVMRGHKTSGEWEPPGVFFAHAHCREEQGPTGTGVPLLKERRQVPQKDAETIWRNLKSMGWKRIEPLWDASAEP